MREALSCALLSAIVCHLFQPRIGGVQSATMFMGSANQAAMFCLLVAVNVFVAYGLLRLLGRARGLISGFVFALGIAAVAGSAFNIELYQIFTSSGWDYRIDRYNFYRDAGGVAFAVFFAVVLCHFMIFDPLDERRR